MNTPIWAAASLRAAARSRLSRTTGHGPSLHRAFITESFGRRAEGQRHRGGPSTVRVITAGPGLVPIGGQRGFAVALNAFRVRPVQGQSGEELRRHAAAPAAVEEFAGGTRTRGLGFTQLQEQRSVLPDAVETPVGQHV